MQHTLDLLKQIAPQLNVVDQSGGSLMICLPFVAVQELQTLLLILESNQGHSKETETNNNATIP